MKGGSGWQQGGAGIDQRRGQRPDKGRQQMKKDFCTFWLFLHSRDHRDRAGGEEAEVLGAAVGVTAAVDITLCHQQVTHTQPGNCTRE